MPLQLGYNKRLTYNTFGHTLWSSHTCWSLQYLFIIKQYSIESHSLQALNNGVYHILDVKIDEQEFCLFFWPTKWPVAYLRCPTIYFIIYVAQGLWIMISAYFFFYELHKTTLGIQLIIVKCCSYLFVIKMISCVKSYMGSTKNLLVQCFNLTLEISRTCVSNVKYYLGSIQDLLVQCYILPGKYPGLACPMPQKIP